MPKPPRAPADLSGPIGQALEAAAQALQRHEPAEAERLASGVLRSDRQNIGAGQVLGTALLMQGRPAEAIEPLQRAAKRSGHPAIETLLARALSGVGRGEEAEALLRQAIVRRPAFPQAFLELGDQLGAAGRFAEAVAVFEEGLSLAPEALVLKVGLAFLCLQRNDRTRARTLFEEVRAAAPERHDALVGLARTLGLEGDYAGAADLYRLALQRRPDDAAVRLDLGKCLLEMGQREAGEAVLRGVAQAGPPLAGSAIQALATAPHGRFFLRPSAAAKFLKS